MFLVWIWRWLHEELINWKYVTITRTGLFQINTKVPITALKPWEIMKLTFSPDELICLLHFLLKLLRVKIDRSFQGVKLPTFSFFSDQFLLFLFFKEILIFPIFLHIWASKQNILVRIYLILVSMIFSKIICTNIVQIFSKISSFTTFDFILFSTIYNLFLQYLFLYLFLQYI